MTVNSNRIICALDFDDFSRAENFIKAIDYDIVYKAKPGRLVVFRSFLPHCVGKHKDTEKRITLAYNFR